MGKLGSKGTEGKGQTKEGETKLRAAQNLRGTTIRAVQGAERDLLQLKRGVPVKS